MKGNDSMTSNHYSDIYDSHGLNSMKMKGNDFQLYNCIMLDISIKKTYLQVPGPSK